MLRHRTKPAPAPLIERDAKEIRAELAAFLGVEPDAVRVEKHKLGEGKHIAFIRVTWTPAWTTDQAEKGKRRG